MAQVGIVKTLEGGVFYAKDSSGNISAYIGILEQCFQNYLNTFCKNIF